MRYRTLHYILTCLHFLFCVGLRSRGIYPLLVTWPHGGRWMRSQCVHRVDAESTGSSNQARARNGYLSEAIDVVSCTTWLNRTDMTHRDHGV